MMIKKRFLASLFLYYDEIFIYVRKFKKARAADLLFFHYCAEGRIFLSSLERDGI